MLKGDPKVWAFTQRLWTRRAEPCVVLHTTMNNEQFILCSAIRSYVRLLCLANVCQQGMTDNGQC